MSLSIPQLILLLTSAMNQPSAEANKYSIPTVDGHSHTMPSFDIDFSTLFETIDIVPNATCEHVKGRAKCCAWVNATVKSKEMLGLGRLFEFKNSAEACALAEYNVDGKPLRSDAVMTLRVGAPPLVEKTFTQPDFIADGMLMERACISHELGPLSGTVCFQFGQMVYKAGRINLCPEIDVTVQKPVMFHYDNPLPCFAIPVTS